MWSHDQWVMWLGRLDSLTLNHKGCSKSNRTQQQTYICITKWGKLVTNWGSFVLLQIRANLVANWGKCCYKLGELLQIKAFVITK